MLVKEEEEEFGIASVVDNLQTQQQLLCEKLGTNNIVVGNNIPLLEREAFLNNTLNEMNAKHNAM